jgi:hypothetical protein
MKTKTFLRFALAALSAPAIMAACGDKPGEEDPVNNLAADYFTIADATFRGGNLPSATTDETFTVAGINNTVLNGGSSFVTVSSPVALSKFFVAVDGIAGYYEFAARQAGATRAGGDYVYEFDIRISQNLGGDFTVKVTAQTASGDIMPAFSHEYALMVAGTGALQVNLGFSNDKDVDLYLVLPAAQGEEPEVIYYNNEGMPGGYDPETYRATMLWGLDIDSNAGCYIDGINSENIFFPTEYVMNGKYEVWVNMFSNCDPETATTWVITALYNGQAINTGFGRNPANGTFPIGEPSNTIGRDYQSGALKVMEFTISGAALAPGELDFYDTRTGAAAGTAGAAGTKKQKTPF